jgi:hypothetical protein
MSRSRKFDRIALMAPLPCPHQTDGERLASKKPKRLDALREYLAALIDDVDQTVNVHGLA